MDKEKITCPAFTICKNLGTSRVACRDMESLSNLVFKSDSIDTQINKTISITLMRSQACLSSIVLLLEQNRHNG